MRKIQIFILSIVAVTSILYSCKQDEKRYIRKNINYTDAQPDIVAMDSALKIMREKNCIDPTSWYYQGAIHWVPDTIKDNRLCASYNDINDLRPAWDNCTHTRNDKEEIHFLIWHRLYIWHFEKIVRKLSGKKDFALPYWAYTDTDRVESNRTLHRKFRNSKSYLYESARFDSLNMGFPITDAEVSRAFHLNNLFDQKTYVGFGTTIDNGIHGAMHDYIGGAEDTTKLYPNKITGTLTPVGLMGWVPTAAFDPVFWIHHSNIDRLWAQWTNSRNGQNVTLDELKSYNWSYTFFDENGKEVVYTPEDIIRIIYTMDYDFDDTEVKPSSNPINQIVRAPSPIQKQIKIKIDSEFTNIPLLDVRAKSIHKLSITVSFLDVPRGVYEVYLNADGTPSPDEDSIIGNMSFFGSDHKVAGQTCIRGCCGEIVNGRIQRTFDYEIVNPQITDAVTQIQIVKWNKQIHKDLVVESIVIE
jgi:hypothetical protein